MDATKARDSIAATAARDLKQALKLARAIDDPWFRCQALAIAAMSAVDRRTRSSLLSEALVAGRQLSDPNRVVSVCAWPIKVFCASGASSQDIERELADLLRVAAREPSPVRRADALNLLMGAVTAAPRALFWMVYEAFLAACTSPLESGKRNSKGESLLAEWAPVISQFDRQRGQLLIESIQGSILRKRAIQATDKASGDATKKISWPNLA